YIRPDPLPGQVPPIQQRPYMLKQWNDLNADGQINGPGEARNPVAYVRNTPAVASAIFQVDPLVAGLLDFSMKQKNPADQLRITGETTGGGLFTATANNLTLDLKTNTLTIKNWITLNQNVGDAVNVIEHFTIAWKLRFG